MCFYFYTLELRRRRRIQQRFEHSVKSATGNNVIIDSFHIDRILLGWSSEAFQHMENTPDESQCFTIETNQSTIPLYVRKGVSRKKMIRDLLSIARTHPPILSYADHVHEQVLDDFLKIKI